VILPGVAQNAKRLSILHFNDVYEVSERRVEPVGGAARFASAIEEQVARVLQETGEKPLIIFAGDCLNPSTLSCATQGEHMIKVMNLLKVNKGFIPLFLSYAKSCADAENSLEMVSVATHAQFLSPG